MISRSVLLTVRNSVGNFVEKNRNAHFVFSNFSSKNRAFYEIMWENNGRIGQARGGSMVHAHCRGKITNTLNLCCFSSAAGYSNAHGCTVYTYNASLVIIIIIIIIIYVRIRLVPLAARSKA